jgi:ketosteroid isomerase-like protein
MNFLNHELKNINKIGVSKTLKTTMLLAFIMLLAPTFTNAQDKELKYKDVVVENPDAETDMKVVSDYVNALVNNELAKAEKLLAEEFMGYGPAVNDSINKQNNINTWKENHKVRSNQKIGFVTQTFRVLQGDLKGDWVSQWGNYSFTQNGKDIKIPYQFTARVSNGMINRSTIYFDNLAVFQQLGYEITPPKQ